MENNGDFLTSWVKSREAVAFFFLFYNTWCMQNFDSDYLKASSALPPLVWEINETEK